MRLWLRLLVLVTVGVFAGLALTLLVEGNNKAASGAFIMTGLLAPLLLEAIWPGKYTLRKPDGDMKDNLVNRLRQFRIDHPGPDGTILLGVMILLGIALIVDMLTRFARLF